MLLLTRYDRMGASSRYRFLQYVPALDAAGLAVTVSPLFDDRYLAGRYEGRRGRWAGYARALVSRIASLRDLGRFKAVVVEKELFPYCPLIAETALLSRPYVLDYDDAIFHQYEHHSNPVVRWALKNKISSLMRGSTLVVAGSEYLADYARRAGAEQVVVVPTVVDLSSYPDSPRAVNDVFTIGWIGSPSTAQYLRAVAPALAAVCAGGRGKLLLIGAGNVHLPGVPVEVLPWSEHTEVRDMRRFDVGIMPLPDEPWARGKCGFKLIQYMACGLPVVASPVGVNTEIVDGSNGSLAKDLREWTRALERLRGSRELRRMMGEAGRAKVEKQYSLTVAAPVIVSLLRSVARGTAGRADLVQQRAGWIGRTSVVRHDL